MLSIGTNSSSKDKNWFSYLRPATSDVRTYAVAVSKNTRDVFSAAAPTNFTKGTSIAKFDKNGLYKWQRFLANTGGAPHCGVAVDSEDNMYIFGLDGGVSGFTVFLPGLRKVDKDGNLIWMKVLSIDSSTKIYTRSITLSADGNYLYCVMLYGVNAVLVKYDLSGNVIAQKRITTSSDLNAVEVCVDYIGNIYVAASSASGVTVVQINSSHNLVWQKNIATLGVFDMACDISNNLYLACYTFEPDPVTPSIAATMSAVLIKYDTSGSLLWQRKIIQTPKSGRIGAGFTGIRVSKDGSTIYCNMTTSTLFTLPRLNNYGGTEFANPSGGEPAVVSFDSNGNYNWSKSFSAKPNATRRSLSAKMDIDNDDTLYLATTGSLQPTTLRFSHGVFKFDAKKVHNDNAVNLLTSPVTPHVLLKDGLATYSFSATASSYVESTGTATYSNESFNANPISNPQDSFSVGTDVWYNILI